MAGLAIKDAVSAVIPHIFTLPADEQFAYVPEAARFLVFIVLIVRFYLGLTFFFQAAYFAEDSNLKYPKKSFTIDFLFGFVQLLFFFILAASMEIHNSPPAIFRLVLAVILLYDFFWVIASSKLDTRRMIGMWASVNLLTLLLSFASFTIAVQFGLDPLRGEEIAFIFILLFSFIDIAEMTIQRRVFVFWLSQLIEEDGTSSARR